MVADFLDFCGKKRLLFVTLSAFVVSLCGCSTPQKAASDCNCSPQHALINEVSIHTLQTSRFSKEQLLKYMTGKCLTIDSARIGDDMEHFHFYPVLICGIPGTLAFHEFRTNAVLSQREIAATNVEFGPIKSYGFTTNLDFIDSTYKKVGITLPSSITTNEALQDTFGRRIHTFGGPHNDSIALYWHGIFFDRLSEKWRGGGVGLLIYDSTRWSEDILLRDDKQTGPQ